MGAGGCNSLLRPNRKTHHAFQSSHKLEGCWATRKIRHHLDELLRTKQQGQFEGRSADIESFQKILTPLGLRPPRIVGVYGLPNVGRRTFVNKAAQLSLSYPKTLEVPIGDGDTLAAVSIKLANLLEPFSTKEGFDAIVASIRQQTEEELLFRSIANLRAANSHKELPYLLDEGGLLSPDGSFTEPIQKLLARADADGDLYVFTVSSRRPPAMISIVKSRMCTSCWATCPRRSNM